MAGHLRHRQRAVLHQDGQVLRADRERHGRHRSDRLRRDVPVPRGGAEPDARRVQRTRGRAGSQPAHAGSEDRLHAGADLHRAQARPQPEVLHLGGAAADERGGSERPVVRHQEHLGRRSRTGQGAGRADQRVQRGHRSAEGAVRNNTKRSQGGAFAPPCLL